MKSRPSSQKSKQSAPPSLSPREKLQAAQADYEKWSAVAAKPGLSPQAAAWALGAARSAKAEADLRQKALDWLMAQSQNGESEADQDLSRLLGVQPMSSDQQPPSTSAKTGISE